MSGEVINGFWSGPRLTPIQELCLKSYLFYGHEFHLYTTELVSNVPAGVVVRSAGEVFPGESLDAVRARFGCEVHLSDYFRVSVVLQNGGWYVDLDTVCLRPFYFPEPYVFTSETAYHSWKSPNDQPTRASEDVQPILSGYIFKSPANSPILSYIKARIDGMDTAKPDWWRTHWLAVGPDLFNEAIPVFGLQKHVKAPCVFDAVNWYEYAAIVTSGASWDFSEKSCALHFRSSYWNSDNCVPGVTLNPYCTYAPDCLFEKLKRKYGVQ